MRSSEVCSTSFEADEFCSKLHLHALIDFPFWGDMSRIAGDWKRYLSNQLGIRLQPNFFDHRLRRDESHDEKWKYIKMNPVRAGLIKNAEDWPYVYESPRTR